MMNEPISTIMTTNLITVTPNDKLSVVKDIFLSKRIHHLPVVEDGVLKGLLTTYDMFKLSNKYDSPDGLVVGDVMTTKLATLEPQQKIGVAAELFLENLFHAVPIVIEGKLQGLVTSFDVLKYSFKKEYPNQEI